MPPRLTELMQELGDDVSTLTVESAPTIRARARTRHRRRVAGLAVAVAAGAAVTIPWWGQDPAPAIGSLVLPSSDTCNGEPVYRDEYEIQARLFLTVDATEAQKEDIRLRLEHLPEVVSMRFESRYEAYQHFAEIYSCAPDFVEATSPKSIPESFIVELARSDDWLAVDAALAGRPGVDTILGPGGTFRSPPAR